MGTNRVRKEATSPRPQTDHSRMIFCVQDESPALAQPRPATPRCKRAVMGKHSTSDGLDGQVSLKFQVPASSLVPRRAHSPEEEGAGGRRGGRHLGGRGPGVIRRQPVGLTAEDKPLKSPLHLARQKGAQGHHFPDHHSPPL